MGEIDRRAFLMRAAAALGLSAQSREKAFRSSRRRRPESPRQRIDIHHQFAPPAWVAEVNGRPLLQTANTTWTPEKSIEDLDRGGIAAAVLSITNPGLWFGDAGARRGSPGRATSMAPAGAAVSDPLRPVRGDAAARRRRHAEGNRLRLRRAEGGRHGPVHELRRHVAGRLAVPSGDGGAQSPQGHRCTSTRPPRTAAGIWITASHPAASKYGTDTTRAIVGVAFSGDSTRYKDITFIWSHAGGSMPFLAGRIDGASATVKDRMPAGFLAEAKKFHYDTAGAVNRGALVSLIELVSPSHVLFGTDFPPGGTNRAVADALASLKLFGDTDLQAIERDNAVRLLPRLNRAR